MWRIKKEEKYPFDVRVQYPTGDILDFKVTRKCSCRDMKEEIFYGCDSDNRRDLALRLGRRSYLIVKLTIDGLDLSTGRGMKLLKEGAVIKVLVDD